jgi:hypothetical protein
MVRCGRTGTLQPLRGQLPQGGCSRSISSFAFTVFVSLNTNKSVLIGNGTQYCARISGGYNTAGISFITTEPEPITTLLPMDTPDLSRYYRRPNVISNSDGLSKL